MTAHNGIVLVTGGSRGIGAATATLLAQQRQRVVIVDIAPEALIGTETILWPDAFDVASETGVVSGIAAIEAAHGPITGLVNAAGVFGKMHAAERVRMDNWDREINSICAARFWSHAASACEWPSGGKVQSSMSPRSRE